MFKALTPIGHKPFPYGRHPTQNASVVCFRPHNKNSPAGSFAAARRGIQLQRCEHRPSTSRSFARVNSMGHVPHAQHASGSSSVFCVFCFNPCRHMLVPHQRCCEPRVSTAKVMRLASPTPCCQLHMATDCDLLLVLPLNQFNGWWHIHTFAAQSAGKDVLIPYAHAQEQ